MILRTAVELRTVDDGYIFDESFERNLAEFLA